MTLIEHNVMLAGSAVMGQGLATAIVCFDLESAAEYRRLLLKHFPGIVAKEPEKLTGKLEGGWLVHVEPPDISKN